MEVILDGRLVQEEEVKLRMSNRAFCYGDGLFETIIARRGTSALLPYHIQRLFKGLDILQLQAPFTAEQLESYIWQLATNHQEALLRLRLQLWREAGGLYTPSSHQAHFLLSASPFEKPGWQKETVSFSTKVQLSHSIYSSLKTMNALPYVLAGLEKKERKLDDLILTDNSGHVAECISSNLFWYKAGSWFTPSLQSGCVAGVMRAYLLEQMQQFQIPVQEVLIPKEELLQADSLIASNVTGLYNIRQLEGRTFENKREQLASLIQLPVL